MLTSTFLHAPTVGPVTERSLWMQGAADWYRFLAEPSAWQVPEGRRSLLVQTLETSVESLERGSAAFFAKSLPSQYRWRAFSDFCGRVGYLDIETTGSATWDDVTMIGLFDGEETHTFVKGYNLRHFPKLLDSVEMLVTYNGGSFDIPILKRLFPLAPFDAKLHVDLCPTLRQLRLRGGLKGVEASLGIERPSDLQGISGWDAVRLWYQYRRGDEDALETLVRYNREDVLNLKPLMEYAYKELRKLTLPQMIVEAPSSVTRR